MNIAIRILTVLCLINVSMVWSQAIYQKNCAELGIAPMENFNKVTYMGLWYVQAMYDYPDSDNTGCYLALYLPSADGNATMIENVTNLDDKEKYGIASLMYFDQPGKGHYLYKKASRSADSTFSEIIIISTDYLNYAIEWSCVDQGMESKCYLWIMSRGRSMSSTIQTKINQILDDHHIDRTDITKMEQNAITCALAQLRAQQYLLTSRPQLPWTCVKSSMFF